MKTFSLTLGIIIALLIALFMHEFLECEQYKQGQIDALTGKVKYSLITQPDSTRIWKKIRD